MVMKLARLYLKIVTTDTKKTIITTTITTATTTTMTEMLTQNIMMRKRAATTVKTMAASLSPHLHALTLRVHHALQAPRDQEVPRVIPVVRVLRETSATPVLRVLPD